MVAITTIDSGLNSKFAVSVLDSEIECLLRLCGNFHASVS